MKPKKTTVKPAANEPGTLGEQFLIIITALAMAEGGAFTRRDFWDEARKEVLEHARENQE